MGKIDEKVEIAGEIKKGRGSYLYWYGGTAEHTLESLVQLSNDPSSEQYSTDPD